MGLAYQNLGEYRRAIELFEQALEIARRIGDVRGEGARLGNMGLAYVGLGEYRKAIELYGQHLEIARRIGHVRGEGGTLVNMGLAYARLGMKDEARECFEESKAVFGGLGIDHMVVAIENMMQSAGIKG
jgi:tetratricopeptide (TPR) repeat protein